METKFRLSRGYSLMELIVVVTIIGVVGVIGFWGIRSSQRGQTVENAKNELLTILRSAQNNVLAGKNGARYITISFSASDCAIALTSSLNPTPSPTPCNLPSGVTLSSGGGNISDLKFCFVNPNLTTAISCGTCGDTYACPSGLVNIDGPNSPQKTIYVSGTGRFASRIYEQ